MVSCLACVLYLTLFLFVCLLVCLFVLFVCFLSTEKCLVLQPFLGHFLCKSPTLTLTLTHCLPDCLPACIQHPNYFQNQQTKPNNHSMALRIVPVTISLPWSYSFATTNSKQRRMNIVNLADNESQLWLNSLDQGGWLC